ncbi:unnamed protein product [Thlaspi arvense]|uniref:HVA22-like protein n=1 Tax=Thlaspi arvense TaxID=13288 RepID=A0AAU9T5K0_THLAR|nr:unnamed protein product [Thlaspi arvense]
MHRTKLIFHVSPLSNVLVPILDSCCCFDSFRKSWLPMYSEAKLAFFIYLWLQNTKGTTYVYASFFKPYVSKHENEIDRNLVELKTKAGGMAMIYLQKAINHGHTRFFEILQYISEQSTPKPQPKEKKQTTTAEVDDSNLKGDAKQS